MAKKKPALSAEEAAWEAAREERRRYLYRRGNEAWEEIKAREEAQEQRAGETSAEGRWRILRRLKRFR